MTHVNLTTHPDAPPRFTRYTFQEYLALDIPATEWRVEELLPTVGLGLILGAEKVGKSLLALQLGLCIAAGIEFLGKTVKQTPVILIEEEGSKASHKTRLERQGAALGLLAENAPLHFYPRQSFNLQDPVHLAELRVAIADLGAKVILAGPAANIAGLQDENSNSEWAQLTRTLTTFSSETESLFILAHHRRKPSPQAGPPKRVADFFSSSRGGSALTAAIDSGIGLTRDPESTEGWLYHLSRDAQSFRMAYDFEPRSLTIHLSTRVDPAEAASPEKLKQLLLDRVTITAREAALATGASHDTMTRRLKQLADRGFADTTTGPHGALTYQASDQLRNA